MSRRLPDPDKYGRESETLLKEMRAEVFKKLKFLGKAVKSFKNVNEQYLILIGHLFEVKDFDQCVHHAQVWFSMILLLHDKSQLVQTGKFQFPRYQIAQMVGLDKICTDITGDFSWRDQYEKYQLNPVSFQGVYHTLKGILGIMQNHDVSYTSLYKQHLN